MKNINQIALTNSPFLKRLSTIDNYPSKLWYLGTIPKNNPSVAIVGSRKPTIYGRQIVAQLSSQLAKQGVIIVSGLAIGHDGLAHQACLEVGGITVAVLGNGLDYIYPRSHLSLANKIISNGGAVISEYSPNTPVMKHHFLERNRLISGLADIVVIIEAGERSGTLNTASHALNQGKDVMAVPGNITSPLSKGCNKLIAQGAEPVTSVDDILCKLNIKNKKTESAIISFNSPIAKQIYQLISEGINDGEVLLDKINCSVPQFNMALTMLELNGYIESIGANQWANK